MVLLSVQFLHLIVSLMALEFHRTTTQAVGVNKSDLRPILIYTFLKYGYKFGLSPTLCLSCITSALKSQSYALDN